MTPIRTALFTSKVHSHLHPALGTFDLGDGQNWYDYQDATWSVQLDLVEEPDDDDDPWFQGVYAADNVQIQIFRNMDI